MKKVVPVDEDIADNEHPVIVWTKFIGKYFKDKLCYVFFCILILLSSSKVKSSVL